MKRTLCLTLLLLCLCAPAMAETWLTIGELRAQTSKRWTQTYETPWRTVTVDAEILLPEAETLPVLLLEAAGEDGYSVHRSTPWPDYPARLQGKRLNAQQEARNNRYGSFDPQGRYVPLSEITLSEITSLVEEALRAAGLAPEAFAHRTPFHLWSQHMFYYGRKQDALPGSLFMEFHPLLNGVPVLSHVKESVQTDAGPARDDECFDMPRCSAVYHGYGAYLGFVSLWCAGTAAVAAEDVPLCPFDKVQAALEEEIAAGRLRKVYEVELGYVLFNEPGVFRTQRPGKTRRTPPEPVRYYARPMWQVRCLYKDTATGRLRTPPGDSDDERNTLDYRLLLIDGQTGELLRPNDEKDRCAYRDVLRWEDLPRP